METVKEVKILAKKLTSAFEKNEEDRCLRYLERLQNVPMTVECLMATKIGKIIKKLKKSSNETVYDMANSLYTEWRELADSAEGDCETRSSSTKRARNDNEIFDPFAAIDQAVFNKEAPVKKAPRIKESVDRHTSQSYREFDMSVRASPSPRPTIKPRTSSDPITTKPKMSTPVYRQPITAGVTASAMMENHLEADRAQTISRLKEARNKGIGHNHKRKLVYDYKLHMDKFVALDNVAVLDDCTAKRVHHNIVKYKSVPSLVNLCLKMAETHIDYVTNLYCLPVFLLDHLLRKCTPPQLARLEEINEYLLPDTDVYWERHCNRADFRGDGPPPGGWRLAYKRQQQANRIRMKSVAQGLTQRYKELEAESKKKHMTIIDPTNDWLRHHGVVTTARAHPPPGQPSGPKVGLTRFQKLRKNFNKSLRR